MVIYLRLLHRNFRLDLQRRSQFHASPNIRSSLHHNILPNIRIRSPLLLTVHVESEVCEHGHQTRSLLCGYLSDHGCVGIFVRASDSKAHA